MIYQINISDKAVNPIYRDYVFNRNWQNIREIFLYGGAGSGKSYATAQHILLAMLLDDYFRCIYVRKVYRTVRNSQYQLFVDLINKYNLNKLFDISKTDMRITYKMNGNMLIASGMDDAEKIKSIQDPNCVWIEEATEITLDDYLQLRTRLRKNVPNLYSICTFNPVSKNNWLFQYINDNMHRDDVYIMHTTMENNKFVNKSYEHTLNEFASISKNFYSIYRLGEWGDEDNDKVFYNYSIVDNLDIDEFDCYGLDFGYSNPTALVGIKYNPEKKELKVKELLYQGGMTNATLIEKLKTIIKDKYKLIYADSEDPARIQEIFNEGFNIHPADKNRKMGLMALMSNKIIIDKHDTNLIHEIRNYQWGKTRDGSLVDEPIKRNDHLIDAMRYAFYTYYTRNFGVMNKYFVKPLKIDII